MVVNKTLESDLKGIEINVILKQDFYKLCKQIFYRAKKNIEQKKYRTNKKFETLNIVFAHYALLKSQVF